MTTRRRACRKVVTATQCKQPQRRSSYDWLSSLPLSNLAHGARLQADLTASCFQQRQKLHHLAHTNNRIAGSLHALYFDLYFEKRTVWFFLACGDVAQALRNGVPYLCSRDGPACRSCKWAVMVVDLRSRRIGFTGREARVQRDQHGCRAITHPCCLRSSFPRTLYTQAA